MTNEEKQIILSQFIQFLNLEKRFPFLPNTKKQRAVADFLGFSEDELLDIRAQFDASAKSAAQELLKEDAINDDLEKLPFDAEDTIVVIGDDAADDLQGWFSILRYVVESATSDQIKWVNAAVTGNNSLDVLATMQRDALASQPDWVFVHLGLHDATHMPVVGNKTMISLADTWENINAMETLISDAAPNPPVWITPTPVIEELVAESPFQFHGFDNKALGSVREIIAGKTGFIVDPQGKRFGNPAEAWNYLANGFQPSLAGHTATVRAVLNTLATAKPQKGKQLGDNVPKDLF